MDTFLKPQYLYRIPPDSGRNNWIPPDSGWNNWIPPDSGQNNWIPLDSGYSDRNFRNRWGSVNYRQMPTHKPWDHAINLMPDFVLEKSKIFLLSPDEHEEMSSFVRDQLQKGYI